MRSTPKVLVVDDNPASIDFLIELLDTYEVQAVLSAEEADEAIEIEKPDVILLDISMPGMNGLEYCRNLKMLPETKNIPVIFVTADDDDETIHQAFKSGGSDYITKPFKNEIVKTRIATQVRIVQLQELLKRAQIQDEETGLRKRTIFMKEAKKWLQFANKASGKVSLIALGIDNLETINRHCGFDRTDMLIKSISDQISQIPENNKIATRRAGALFLVMIYGIDEVKAARYADQLRASISIPNIPGCNGVLVNASSGVADNLLFDDLEQMISAAVAKMKSH
jgi:diguanylate cyclase (GGDEF)-like protein